jgi:hypothetical protein
MRATRFSIGSLLAVIGIFGVALAALRNPSYLWANAAFTTALLAVTAAVVNTVYGRGGKRAYWLGFALFGGTYLSICSIPALCDLVCPRLVTEAILSVIYPFMAPHTPSPSSPFPATAVINGSLVTFSPAPVTTVPAPAMLAPPIALVGSGPAAAAPLLASPPAWIPPPVPPLPPVSILPPISDPWTAWTAPDRTPAVYRVGSITYASSEAFRRIGHSLAALLVATLGGVFARNRYHVYARDGRPPEPASLALLENSTIGSASSAS